MMMKVNNSWASTEDPFWLCLLTNLSSSFVRVESVCVLWVTHFTSTLLRLLTKMPQRAKHEAASGVSNATKCTLALIRVLITHVQRGAADLWAFVIAAHYISPGKQSTPSFSHRKKKTKTKCQHHSFHFAEKHTQRWTLSGQVDNRQQSWVRFAP